MNWTELLFKDILPVTKKKKKNEESSPPVHKMTHPPVKAEEDELDLSSGDVLRRARSARQKKVSVYNDLSEALENGDLDLVVEIGEEDE